MDLRNRRNKLGISQTRLARISGVSRFRICMFELDNQPLTDAEQRQIDSALKDEVQRKIVDLRNAAEVRAAL